MPEDLQSLRCSFCGKPASQVRNLVAGPGVFICDACVATCTSLLDIKPTNTSDSEAMTDEHLLTSLLPALAAVEAARTTLQAKVTTLRRRGVSWAAIGGALGISRQAAWERFSRSPAQPSTPH